MSAAMGAFSRFQAVASGTTPDAEYEFTDPQLRVGEELVDPNGLRGSRESASERVRQGIRSPGFTLTMQPNSVELDTWLPRILGGSESTDDFPLAETLPTFTAFLFQNLDSASTWRRWVGENAKVARARFFATAGGPLNLTIDVEVLDWGSAGAPDSTAPASVSISTVGPYMFSDTTVSGGDLAVNGSTLNFFDWSLEIDNMLKVDRHMNKQTRVSLPEMGRSITWTFDGPYGDNVALYGLSSAGVVANAKFVLSNRSLRFNSAKVAFPRQPPTLSGREEIRLPLVGIARKDGSTASLTTTNDSTP